MDYSEDGDGWRLSENEKLIWAVSFAQDAFSLTVEQVAHQAACLVLDLRGDRDHFENRTKMMQALTSAFLKQMRER